MSFLRVTGLAVLIWLSIPVLVFCDDQSCGVSIAFHPSQKDTVKAPDRWIAWDKAQHVGVSAFFSGVFFDIFHHFYHNRRESSAYLSASLTLSLGLGKEFHDRRTPHGRFSYKDLAADMVGIGLGLWIAAR
ncbi:MAG: hypothetical protein WCE90_05400 [Candidatus Zixiibacteriota bacterium]